MPIFTLVEIFYLIVLVGSIGYIFSGFIKDPASRYISGFNWRDFRFALLVAAPGIILHELLHKFVAIFFGLVANFYIFWSGLGIAVFLKLISSPFLIIAPGYVYITGDSTPLQSAIISFAGPLANLLLWFIAYLTLNNAKNLSRQKAIFLYLTKKINLTLFIFNMIPIPPLDGFNFIYSLFTYVSYFST